MSKNFGAALPFSQEEEKTALLLFFSDNPQADQMPSIIQFTVKNPIYLVGITSSQYPSGSAMK